VTPGISTWSELDRRSGNVLLIVNSASGADSEVEASSTHLAACGDVLHVIAPSSWRRWFDARGVSAERVRYTRDCDGSEVELNYFLETMPALRWIESKRFALVAGSAPHSMYNEEVKEIFEQRVTLFLGQGLFVAHALPQPYLYLFDRIALLARQARYAKVDRYRTLCRAIVDDCHRVWREHQSRSGPDAAADRGCAELSAVLKAHFGAAFLEFDEVSAIAVPREQLAVTAADAAARFADVATHLGEVIRERDGLLAPLTNTPGRRLRRWLRGLVRE
jgi:hypothetical protein